jgi:hypothetical protein
MVVLLLILPLAGNAYRDGPAANVAGGFGEPSCQECHFDQPLNDPGGTLAITGTPDRYLARQSYRMTVALSRASMSRGGFEMSARFAAGDRAGQQAGVWRTLDDRVQIVRSEKDPPVFFVQHNTKGSAVAQPGMARWTVEWTAPEDATDAVQFNAAGNAANDDASALGDYVYLSEVRSSPN